MDVDVRPGASARPRGVLAEPEVLAAFVVAALAIGAASVAAWGPGLFPVSVLEASSTSVPGAGLGSLFGSPGSAASAHLIGPEPLNATTATGGIAAGGIAGPEDGADTGMGTAAKSIVGTVPYDGPAKATDVIASCSAQSHTPQPCYILTLEKLLAAKGSPAAFDMLADMAANDSAVNAQSHVIAHALGAFALEAYGSIQDTLADCSYKVFAGCFHGSLQAYFEGLPRITSSNILGLCPSDNLFRQYTCLHGVGHGLMLAEGGAINTSMAFCDVLDTSYARESCYGGAFMENVVGYMDSRSGNDHHHSGKPMVYSVNTSDLQFPCDSVEGKYRESCWLIHTSLILFLNGGDFAGAGRVCEQVPAPWTLPCYKSVGRDATDYSGWNATGVARRCALVPEAGRDQCIRGFAATVVLNFASPEAALPSCRELPAEHKVPCYDQVGVQAISMLDADGRARLCAQAEQGYENTCRQGAALFPA